MTDKVIRLDLPFGMTDPVRVAASVWPIRVYDAGKMLAELRPGESAKFEPEIIAVAMGREIVGWKVSEQ